MVYRHFRMNGAVFIRRQKFDAQMIFHGIAHVWKVECLFFHIKFLQLDYKISFFRMEMNFILIKFVS